MKIGVRELSHRTSRCLALVKRGETLEVTEHGHIIATISPAGESLQPRPRPRIGGYSFEPLTAAEIDEALGEGFGEH